MRHLLAVVAGLAVFAASACSAPAPPRAEARPPAAPTGPPVLPAPTGGRPVGRTILHLTDTSRPDPWNLDADARRLKVTLWYPAEQADGPPAPYVTDKESALAVRRAGIAGMPDGALTGTRTHATEDAAPAGENLPLVVLSPGFTNPISTLTSLAEDLASRGYVVAGIDHTYESYATTLADGQVAECLACDSDNDPGFGAVVVRVRAADVSFVLDRLPAAWDGSAVLDRSKIAMVGQSIGGAAAVAAMVRDPRVRAGINMDGTTYARIPKSGLSKPLMFLASAGHVPGSGAPTWDRDWKLLTGWKRWLMVESAEHSSFTDGPLLQAALGVRPAEGVLPAARGSELARAYVAAFLDRHLKGERRPLLDGPSPRHPEVRFCPADCGR